jgi:type IV pilus assembly protein PilB
MNLSEDIILLTDNIHLLTKDQAWHYRILPKHRTTEAFTLYCEEGIAQNDLISELEILTGLNIMLEAIPPVEIAKLLSKYYLKDNAAQGMVI